MDGETKALMLVIAAVAAGVAIGWCMRHDIRMSMRARSPGASPSSAPDQGAFIPVTSTSSPGGCCTGCRS